MLPIIVLICIEGMPSFSAKSINRYLLASFLITILILGPLLYNYDNGNSVKFNFLSKEVLINTPGLYNPPYDVYAERALGGEFGFDVGFDDRLPIIFTYNGVAKRTLGGEFGFDDRLPIIFTYNGIPRKALTNYEGLGVIEQFADNPIKKDNFEQIKKSEIGYINFENRVFKFPYNESELMIFDKKAIEDILSGKLTFSINDSYGAEEWSGTPTRWMQASTTLLVNSSEDSAATLSLNAQSFYRNRTLEVYRGNELLTKKAIPTKGFVAIEVSVHLVKGANALRLSVPEGCERPSDIKGLNSTDERCLSVAIQNMNLGAKRSSHLKYLNGFYDTENWSGTPTRWMETDSAFRVNSTENRTARLSLRAISFYRPRTMEIYVEDELATSVAVPPSFINVTVPVHLFNGMNVVRLQVPEGCERPCDINALNNPDSRCLSIAVQNMTIT
jgi:hypothetical protein